MKVLELSKEIKQEAEKAQHRTRTGLFTTGIISIWQGRLIALFITGRQHAGENFGDLLEQRDADRKTDQGAQMGDMFMSLIQTCKLQKRDFVQVGLEIIRRYHSALPAGILTNTSPAPT